MPLLPCSCSPDLPPRFETVPETGSTSTDLLARLSRGEPVAEGYWLVADRQSAGRGRQGRNWLDGAGNFMGSTAVALHRHDPPAPSLSFIAALAVYDTLVPHLANPHALSLKWPNDVLLGNAKLAGILLERVGDTAVIGIGVNLASAPALPDRAVGDWRSVGPALDRDTFARDLARSFDRELGRWRQFGLEPILGRWLAAAHPLGSPLSVHAGNGASVSGEFAGLEADGALRLRLADGTVRVIHAGDVTVQGT
ncbi:MAG TPA: biotin--[acetyl-CoA-carboxylase] ligase [Croceibacterium sp.]|nr:biotin--[acetyl-CoA-carboxylase] ligase [Croceibacterium sp.]